MNREFPTRPPQSWDMADFTAALTAHDFLAEMSDDFSAWQAARYEREAIVKASTHLPRAKELLDARISQLERSFR